MLQSDFSVCWDPLDFEKAESSQRLVRCCPSLHGSLDFETQDEVCEIVVPCDPDEFIRRALIAGHPRGAHLHMSADIERAAELDFVSPPFELAKLRAEFVKRWTARAQELASEERQLHATVA